MKNILLKILIFIAFTIESLIAFPGDHNSLTCDQNFIDITLSPSVADLGGTFHSQIDEKLLDDYLRKSQTVLANNPAALANRARIIAAINADLNSSSSKIKQKIKENHDSSNFEGHPLQVTKWGDSLSDFVSFYGVLTPGALGSRSYSTRWWDIR
ncbi:MAG TPA: hypothetical protein PKX55_18630, partial [Leptospiraceae bacterium]|nr:hypothetical protein [Leptospiraceae bacterium]